MRLRASELPSYGTARILLILVGLAIPRFTRAEDLPRYKLRPGQEVIYRTANPPQSEADAKRGKARIDYEWNVVAIGEGEPGSLRLVLRQQLTSSFDVNGQTRTQVVQSDGYYDLWPDGRLVDRRKQISLSDLSALFPPLPADAAELAGKWETTTEFTETHRVLRKSQRPSPTAHVYLFEEEFEGPTDAMYLGKNSRDYEFDAQQGLVRKVNTSNKSGWPKPDERLQTIELVGTRQFEPDELKALADESELYFAAYQEHAALVRRIEEDYTRADELLGQAQARLEEALARLKLPWMRTTCENALAQLKRDRSFEMMKVSDLKAVVGKPAADWKTTDIDGKPRQLSDYRGRVVVLDFWYRGCGWCTRSMPQIKQVVDDFAGQPVSVLGMNWDSDDNDARFVIDKLKLNYPTLKNGQGLNAVHVRYRVRGWPTLVIIDREGVLRHLHFGYSPTLRQLLGDKIRALLAENAPAAGQ